MCRRGVVCLIFFETLLCCLLSLGTTNTSLLLQPPSRPPFPMLFAHSPAIETISIGTPQQHDLFVDSDLTALQARAIALEAATSKTGGRVFFSRHPLLCLWCRKYMKNVPTTIFSDISDWTQNDGKCAHFLLPPPPTRSSPGVTLLFALRVSTTQTFLFPIRESYPYLARLDLRL